MGKWDRRHRYFYCLGCWQWWEAAEQDWWDNFNWSIKWCIHIANKALTCCPQLSRVISTGGSNGVFRTCHVDDSVAVGADVSRPLQDLYNAHDLILDAPLRLDQDATDTAGMLIDHCAICAYRRGCQNQIQSQRHGGNSKFRV